jgi:hypothetical protein
VAVRIQAAGSNVVSKKQQEQNNQKRLCSCNHYDALDSRNRTANILSFPIYPGS